MTPQRSHIRKKPPPPLLISTASRGPGATAGQSKSNGGYPRHYNRSAAANQSPATVPFLKPAAWPTAILADALLVPARRLAWEYLAPWNDALSRTPAEVKEFLLSTAARLRREAADSKQPASPAAPQNSSPTD